MRQDRKVGDFGLSFSDFSPVGFREYKRHLTGQSKDNLMITSVRSLTLAVAALGIAALGLATENPQNIVIPSLVVAGAATLVARVTSAAAIIKAGDPLGRFARRSN